MSEHKRSLIALPWALLVVIVLLAAGCAAGNDRFTSGDPAGFFMGIWHGLISCIALIIGIFDDSVEIYERVNTGGWYDFGFLIGVGLFSGSGHKSHSSWKKKKDGTCGEIQGGKASVKVDVTWTSDDDANHNEPAPAKATVTDD